PGAGPRHLTFAPNGRFLYLVNELQSSICAFAYDEPTGALNLIQTISALPKDFKGENTSAEIEVSPSGKFLYASNRAYNSLAVFSIHLDKGTLTTVEYVSTRGKTPNSFAIDPTGTHLIVANYNSNNLIVFRIDRTTGRLTSTGQAITVKAPACILFVGQ